MNKKTLPYLHDNSIFHEKLEENCKFILFDMPCTSTKT